MCEDDLCYKFYNNTLQYAMAILVKKESFGVIMEGQKREGIVSGR